MALRIQIAKFKFCQYLLRANLVKFNARQTFQLYVVIIELSDHDRFPLQIDMKKMPLGKLSKRQIQNAYSVLTELQTEISGAKDPTKILDASNRFYTLIPHDFGLRRPPLLDSEDIIRAKTQMLDNLLEIEVAYSLLKQEDSSEGEAKDPLDVHFEQLKTDMEVSENKVHVPILAWELRLKISQILMLAWYGDISM